MNKMNEQNQRLHYYKAKTEKQQQLSRTLERSVSKFTKALEMRETEIAELRKKYKEQDEQKQREVRLLILPPFDYLFHCNEQL